MSHPLKRRMAQVALLVAAAAPVIGLGAGTASAAGLPQAADLGGISSADAAAALGGTVDGATHQASGLADRAGGDAQQSLLPAAQQTAESAGHHLAPAAQKTLGDTAGQAGKATGGTAGGGLTGGLPLNGVAPGDALHNGPMLPVGALPAV